MKKPLEDLTKEDWDTLFPIELVDYDPYWKKLYEAEKGQIINQIGDKIIRIEHVGSTSIPAIKAKSYIDISIELSEESLFSEDIIDGLTNLGYSFFRQADKKADYMIFVKGYNPAGKKEQIYHIHACPPGHEMLHQITFRDFLIANRERAKEYELLKTELASRYKNDRTGYRKAKSHFIAETIMMAEENI
ncbi:MAG: GrpB family protein [Bacteroidota bacterium]